MKSVAHVVAHEATAQNFICARKSNAILFARRNNAKFNFHVAWAFKNCQLLIAEMK